MNTPEQPNDATGSNDKPDGNATRGSGGWAHTNWIAEGAHTLDAAKQHLADEAARCVRKEPVKNLLIAAGVGFVLARLT